MKLSKQQLLFDLYVAFYCSRRGKSKRSYVRKWERNLKENMEQLCDELYNRTYQPQPSKCFIVNYPKKREIFAAMFRDRIVHHLYYNYTHELYERNFIADAYSCIIGRGTHYGINRLKDFCRRESRNYQRKAYVMHLDIRGYFMHIDRHRLLEISLRTLNKMGNHKTEDGRRWSDVRDMDFLRWLSEVIITIDPVKNCITVGDPSDWEGLDAAKSMLNLKPGLGLPIGNLTSQLFSNVYLNEFDQFMKRTMKCKYYGRYVDDAFIVSADKDRLLRMVPQIQSYLTEHLGLCKSEVKASKMLFYIPLFLVAFSSVLSGFAPQFDTVPLIARTFMMLFVGFLEEIIFRGFLFRGMAKDGLKSAVIVSALTFGIGHIVNLLNGYDITKSITQIVFAVAVGFLLVMIFIRTGSLIACIAFHSLNNICTGFSSGELLKNAVGENNAQWVILGVCLVITALYLGYIMKFIPKKNALK